MRQSRKERLHAPRSWLDCVHLPARRLLCHHSIATTPTISTPASTFTPPARPEKRRPHPHLTSVLVPAAVHRRLQEVSIGGKVSTRGSG
jgi:hypothetical protein